MKKIISLILIVGIFVFSFASCKDNEQSNTSSQTVSAQKSEIVKLAEKGEIGNVEYKISDAIDTI